MNRLHYDRTHVTTTVAVALAAFGLGAAIMYILDPESGSRRRAYARDKALDAANDAVDAIGNTARGVRSRAQDTANRVQDSAAEVKGVLSQTRLTTGE